MYLCCTYDIVKVIYELFAFRVYNIKIIFFPYTLVEYIKA